MKTKQTWLWILMIISCWSVTSLGATDVKVVSTTGTCSGGGCKGNIKLALNVSAGPLIVELQQGNTIKATKSFRAGIFDYTFSDLCTGVYKIKYYPEQFPSCAKFIDGIEVKDEAGFEVNIVGFPPGEVKVEPSISGNFLYYWSFDGVTYNAGTNTNRKSSYPLNNSFIYVKVLNVASNCFVIKKLGPFTADCPYPIIRPEIQVQEINSPNDKKIIAKLKLEYSNISILADPNKFAFIWRGKDNQVIGTGPELVISKNNPNLISSLFGKFVVLEVVDECGKSTSTFAMIFCEDLSSEFLAKTFIQEIKPYCNGIPNSGYINLKSYRDISLLLPLPTNKDQFYYNLKLDGVRVSPVTQLDNTSAIGLYLTFNSGGQHTVTIELNQCSYSFQINIETVQPQYTFNGVSKQGVNLPSLCLYNLKCATSNKQISVAATRDIQSETKYNGACGYDIYCDLDGIKRNVGKDQYDYLSIPAGMFQYVLLGGEEQARINNDYILEQRLRRDREFVGRLADCNMVKYCPLTFERISSDHPLLGAFRRHESCSNGCVKITCGIVGQHEYNSCAYTSYRKIDKDCCPNDAVRSLLDLCNAYNQLKNMNQLSNFYVRYPAFRQSELENLLIEYSSGAYSDDPRMRCAATRFCPVNFSLMEFKKNPDPFKPLDNVECGQDIAVPPVNIIINLTQSGIIADANKIAKKFLNIYKAGTHWVGSEVDKIKELFKVTNVSRCPSFSNLGSKGRFPIGVNIAEFDNPRVVQLQSDPYNSILTASLADLITPSTEIEDQQMLDHTFTDTTANQTLDRFSMIYSEGNISPKLLFKVGNKQHYYNYSHQIDQIEHFEQKGIEHLIEDWDEKADYYVRNSHPHKEYLITRQDTASLWALPLVSDSLLSVEHFSRYDSLIYVAGYYKGLLYLGGKAIDSLHNYNRTNAFFLQIDKSGKLIDISLAENIDTTGGLSFSENKAGVIQLAVHAGADTIKVNGLGNQMPQSKAVAVLKYSDVSKLQFLNAIGNSSTAYVAGLTLAPGATTATLALFGGGNTSIQNGFPTLANNANNLNLLSFGANGSFNSARSSTSTHLLPRKFAISYGAGNGLLLGVTYDQTTTIFGDTLSNEGKEDFAVLKYTQNGILEWGDSYGTPESESVSRFMHDNQGIAYFAGEISGVQDARLIGNYIFSDTTKTANQRVYLSYLIDTLSTTNTPQLISTPNSIEIVKNTSAVDLVQSLGVYPNPFTNQATVVYNASEAGTYQLTVLNEVGNLVENQQVELGVGYNSKILSTQHYIPGFYYLTLRNSSGKIIGAQKLIKE